MTSGPATNSTFTSVRFAALVVALLAIFPLTGCRICTNTEDLAYPSYGGAWQRTLRESGRVGSVYDPGGAQASSLVSREDPITADEIERNRRDAEGIEEDDPEMDDETEDEEGMDEGPDGDDGTDGSDSDRDDEVEKKKQELRDQKFDEVKVIPGDPLPPLLR